MTGLRVLIAGGGTGGHVFPGLAVARAIEDACPGALVTFAGTARGLEARLVPGAGYSLDLIRSRGLQGVGWRATLQGVAALPISLRDAWGVLSRRVPQVVIGVGGYSSGPVVLAAWLRRIPTMLLEQNAVPGLTNRWLAPVVDAAAVTYEATLRYFGGRGVVTGNPVRADIVALGSQPSASSRTATDGRGSLLVFGGSQGAHAVNVAMMAAATVLAQRCALHITHQTGPRDHQAVSDAYAAAHIDATVVPFIDDMASALAQADLVVCRAGATTLAELAAAARPAILIPLPTATNDHQRLNAEAVAATGAAVLLQERDASGEHLAAQIAALLQDGSRRRQMASAARALSRPQAASLIAARAIALAGGC